MSDLGPSAAAPPGPAPQVVGVIPAAGHATRLQPLRCSKEVYPIGGRPVMEHLVERMRAAPADRVRVVTRPDKEDVIAHCRREGHEVVLGRPASVSESLLLGAEGLSARDVVLIGFPDTLWEPADGFARLVARLDDEVDLALGLFRTPELERCDVVVPDGRGLVRAIAVKPERPPSPWIWSCAAARARVLAGMAGHAEPGAWFDRLCREGPVAGVPLSDRFVDVGTPETLRAAERQGGLGPPGPPATGRGVPG